MQITRCSQAGKKGTLDSSGWTGPKHSTGHFSLRSFPPLSPVVPLAWPCLWWDSPGNSQQVGHQPSQVFLFYSVMVAPGRKGKDGSSSFISPTWTWEESAYSTVHRYLKTLLTLHTVMLSAMFFMMWVVVYQELFLSIWSFWANGLMRSYYMLLLAPLWNLSGTAFTITAQHNMTSVFYKR